MKARLYIMILVVVIIAASAIFVLNGGPKDQTLATYDNKLVPASFLSKLNISDSISNQVGIGSVTSFPTILANATPLKIDNKTVVFYYGAEFCPFCAAERWGMLIALMRFGTFSGVKFMTSSATDAVSPSTPTFTFYNSSYYSPYITFMPVETETNTGAPLESPTSQEQALFNFYDANNQQLPSIERGSIPFIDIGNYSIQIGANYQPKAVLYATNWSVIAQDLQSPSSVQSQAIIGTANLLTAQICVADNNTPQNVCNQNYVKSIEKQLGA